VTFDRRRRGDARSAILAATVLIVAEQGLDAVTHRRIATEAGVSPGSTTHHFASRTDLLREAFRFYLHEGDGLLGSLEEQARTHDDPLDRLRALLVGLIDAELEHASLLRAEYELLLFASGDEELATDVRAWESRWVAHLAEPLEAAGAPRPIEAARTLLNLVRGFELERLLDARLTRDDFARRLDLVLDALRS
jgi:TetR/AcrR family transcriptional regulator, regulator of biofilm formation and stress response